MKRSSIKKISPFLLGAIISSGQVMATGYTHLFSGYEHVMGRDTAKNDTATLVINGTGASGVFKVSGKDLPSALPIQITVSAGFSLSQTSIPAGSKDTPVTVTLTSTKNNTDGLIVLRSGDIRSYIKVKGVGTALPQKDLSKSAAYHGGDATEFVKTSKDGFKPSNKGYTVEFKAKIDENGEFALYAVNNEGIGFKGYATPSEMGLYNSEWKSGFPNPVTSVDGGLSKFYNDDGNNHIFRYAVTPDNRLFIYRDGIPVDSVRTIDYGTQPDFATANGDPKENLLKNPGFEGEYDTKYDNHMAVGIEGWNILIGDRYNSEQYILPKEIDNNQDINNHILEMRRYMWADGWSAAEISQVVDVAPNETYSLSALIKGGIKEKEGTTLGKMKIREMQDNSLGKSVDITSNDWQTYSLDYTTSANCKQLMVTFYLERDKWGAHISPMDIDNVKLTGKSRLYSPKVGFENNGTKVSYFAYDDSGAYAPATSPQISVTVGK